VHEHDGSWEGILGFRLSMFFLLKKGGPRAAGAR